MKNKLTLFIPLLILAFFGLFMSIKNRASTVFLDLLFFVVILVIWVGYRLYDQKVKKQSSQRHLPINAKKPKPNSKTVPLARKTKKASKPYPFTVIEGNKAKKRNQST